MGLAFFGLTSDTASQHRINVLTEVHELVFYGGGGYIWSEVYNMPIYLRRFTLSKLKEHFESVNKANNPEKPGSQTLVDSSGKITPNQVKNASSKYK